MKTFPISLLILVSICACTSKQPTEAPQSLMEASKQELATAVTERDMLFALVKEISKDMEEIKRMENIMTVTPVSPEAGVKQYSQLRNDMAALKRSIRKRRQQLADIEGQLQQSDLFTGELQDVIDIMRRQIDSQTAEIDNLNKKLLSANTHIVALTSTIDSLSQSIDEAHSERDSIGANAARFESELYTCYYIADNKSVLKEMRIIESGFLRSTKLTGEFDRNKFTAADKRTLAAIRLDTDKSKVLSSHPKESYRLINDGNTNSLIITDPEKFWSNTNYLIIQTD